MKIVFFDEFNSTDISLEVKFLLLWQYSVGSIGAKKVIVVFGEFVAQWDLMNSDIWLLFQAPQVIL